MNIFVIIIVLFIIFLIMPQLKRILFNIHLKLNKKLKYAYSDNKTSANGFWNDKQRNNHITSEVLKKRLLKFYKKNNVKKIIDFGCGDCSYVKFLRKNNINAYGIDYNNLLIGNDYYIHSDLTKNIVNKCEFSQSFEVGEHIPKDKMNIFIDNICNNSEKGVILSWASKGQGGDGHINEQNNDYIIKKFEKRGFKYNEIMSDYFRNANYEINFLYFMNIIVFTKI